MEKEYKVVNGTHYHINTPDNLIEILERCRANSTRLLFDFGNTETKVSWGEIYGISGRIGRSTGTQKIPLLIHSARSTGGSAFPNDCILSVRESKTKKLLYQL
jgi:hypothetical protein